MATKASKDVWGVFFRTFFFWPKMVSNTISTSYVFWTARRLKQNTYCIELTFSLFWGDSHSNSPFWTAIRLRLKTLFEQHVHVLTPTWVSNGRGPFPNKYTHPPPHLLLGLAWTCLSLLGRFCSVRPLYIWGMWLELRLWTWFWAFFQREWFRLVPVRRCSCELRRKRSNALGLRL